MTPYITLEQWRTLIEVVDTGGYAQAANKLNKSQSAITYAIQKIEAMLDVKAFEIQGRKAVLTETGQMLYRRALALVNEAYELEIAASKLSAGWEATITLAVEILYPMEKLMASLHQFGMESPSTRIEVIESVLGGTSEALLSGQVDLAISPQVPTGFLGNILTQIKLIAVAHPDHPLHHQRSPLSYPDLHKHRHIVVRDSGNLRDSTTVTVDVEKRWTVSNISTSIQAVANGYGFAWLPEDQVQNELKNGHLKILPLREGGIRQLPLYMIIPRSDVAGPGVRHLSSIITQAHRVKID